MLPPNLTAHPPKQKAKTYARSQSVPVELEAQHDDKETSQISKKNFLELYKLVWTYAQITQDRVFDQGKIAYKYVKHFSFGYLKTKMHHKSNAIKFGLRILGKMSLYLYREKMYLIFAYLSMIISSITATKLPQLVGKMIDISVVEHDSNELMEQAKFFFCIAVIHLISEFFWNHLFAMLSQRIRWALKEQMYSALLKREIEYFDKRPLNDVINSVNGLIGRVENICTVDVANLVRNAIQFAYCAWMLTNISLKLTGLIIMIVPFHILLPMVFQKFKARHNAAEWDVICRTEKTVMETFQNVRIVKAFSTEDSELEKYNKLLDANHDASLKSSKSGSLNMAMSGFFTNFTLLCVIYVGMVLVNKGEVSPGSLSSFLLLSMAVSTSFRDCTFNYMQLKEKIPACQTLFGIMEDAPKIPHKGGKKIENFEGNVELENVHFSYPVAPDVPILKGVSLKIKAGQSAAFVGMSGGGKSTIISLLLRFYDISDGSVKLDGVDIRDVDLQWLHSHFGFVSQDPILFSGTIEQNITYGLQSYTQETLLKAINMANATFIFNKDLFPNGLQSDIGERGGALSGGQKQRLAIARALMREPKVLILDEATSNLDANAEFEVQTAIDNLITSSNLTVITIAHRLSTIIKCDVIFVLKSGQVVEQGNHKELVARGGVYKNLVEKQFQTPSHH